MVGDERRLVGVCQWVVGSFVGCCWVVGDGKW